MKTASLLKSMSKEVQSPKTPGGISKSLLTPCRRVGLSRNWRKKGPLPFKSPVSDCTETKLESTDRSRKRKQCGEVITKEPDEELSSKEYIENSQNNVTIIKSKQINTTPRSTSILPSKICKTSITSKIDDCFTDAQSPEILLHSLKENEQVQCEANVKNKEIVHNEEKIVTGTNFKSKSRSKNLMVQSFTKTNFEVDGDKMKENVDINEPLCHQKLYEQKSPENLTKECIVVIQKKIFKKDFEKIKDINKIRTEDVNPASQAMFDSDSDDIPLNLLNKNVPRNIASTAINIDEDDFADITKVKVKKLEDKTTSTGSLLNQTNIRKKSNKQKEVIKKQRTDSGNPEPKKAHSFDDDEDFVMDKRTILVRKSYDKVTKPLKANSTGSITQKDIDNIKSRIETKKKLLLAKAMTEDTEELRTLIKKWQKGCQDALIELIQLMRQKFPDKQNMDYSEILQSLNIPASMVGYDEENDSFITPTDEDIVLTKFKNL